MFKRILTRWTKNNKTDDVTYCPFSAVTVFDLELYFYAIPTLLIDSVSVGEHLNILMILHYGRKCGKRIVISFLVKQNKET